MNMKTSFDRTSKKPTTHEILLILLKICYLRLQLYIESKILRHMSPNCYLKLVPRRLYANAHRKRFLLCPKIFLYYKQESRLAS